MTTLLLQPKFATETGSYTFSSPNRPVTYKKKHRDGATKIQDGGSPTHFSNVMWDRRVVRGSTIAQQSQQVSQVDPPDDYKWQIEARRRSLARRKSRDLTRIRTPPPVEGRAHAQIQTEVILEELKEPVQEEEVSCQTDLFFDRPSSPLFVPANIGVDAQTQLCAGELFDFEVEVEPMLEVLVGRTVDQAMREVLEEEELSGIRRQQRKFQEIRLAQLAQHQRRAEIDRRIRREKEQIIQDFEDALLKQEDIQRKGSTVAFSRSYLSDLVPSIDDICKDGKVLDPVQRDIEEDFLPWLMEKVDSELSKYGLPRKIIDGLVREALEQQRQLYRNASKEKPMTGQQLSSTTQE